MSVSKNRIYSPKQTLSYLGNREYGNDTLLKQRFIGNKLSNNKNIIGYNLKAHFGCVNAIEFSPDGGRWIVSGGDDHRVILWNTEKALHPFTTQQRSCGEQSHIPMKRSYKPTTMKGEHHSNIFCLAFDNSNTKIYSGGNDEQVVVHDVETGETLDVFMHSEAVYSLAVDPNNDNVFASACDDGKVLIYDIREPATEDPFVLANYHSPMHAVVYNPAEPRLLATANAKEGIGLWDIRRPNSSLLRYGDLHSQQSCMSVRINKLGTHVIALRRCLPPVLYNLNGTETVCLFDHPGYYNSCTMKSCCFAGRNDEYILSGSEDFNLYMWRIPDDPIDQYWIREATTVLRGHRSIVNQVRYNATNNLVLSSGVEKIIKVWNPFILQQEDQGIPTETAIVSPGQERPVYTHEEYISLVLHSGTSMTHDYSQQSTEEDPRMMAFFDSLVQRELDGLSSDEMDLESSGLEPTSNIVMSDTSLSDSSTEDAAFSPFTVAFASVMAQRQRELDFVEEQRDSDSNSGSRDGLEPQNQQIAIAQSARSTGNGIGNGTSNGLSTESRNEEDLQDDIVTRSPTEQDASKRISISSLIAQKRVNYLASVHKLEQKAKKKMLRKKADIKRRIRLCLEQNASSSSSSSSLSSSSSSSSSGSDSGSDNDKTLGLFHDSDACDDEDQPSTNPQDIRDALRLVSSQTHQGNKSDVLKWKRLRSQIANSDTEPTVSGGAGSWTSKPVFGVNENTGSSVETNSYSLRTGLTVNGNTSVVPCCNESDIIKPSGSASNNKFTDKTADSDGGEHETGPHIHDSKLCDSVNSVRVDSNPDNHTFHKSTERHCQASGSSKNTTGNLPNVTTSTEGEPNKTEFTFRKRSDAGKRRYRGRKHEHKGKQNDSS